MEDMNEDASENIGNKNDYDTSMEEEIVSTVEEPGTETADADMMSGAAYYTPAPGQDIYGRVIDETLTSSSTAKYVPPARRAIINQVSLSSRVYQLDVNLTVSRQCRIPMW
jgi:hypothetical protein